MILRQPQLLAAIDAALDRAEQAPLSVDDFEELLNREVFRAIRAAAHQSSAPTVEQVQAALEPALHDQLAGLLGEMEFGHIDLSAGNKADEDLQRVGLQLREHRLKREGLELQVLLQADDLERETLSALGETTRANAAALRRLQQILSARTITRQYTSDPWSRS
jgi:hypothetical protein